MKSIERKATWMIVIAILLLGGCASSPGISTDVNYCCRPVAESIYTYRVVFEDTPEFLKPMLRDSVSIVLDSKGLQYTEGEAHAVLAMRYVDRTLSRQEEADVESWERTAPGGGVRSAARSSWQGPFVTSVCSFSRAPRA